MNITVTDDEEVRVGKVTIEVIQTAGDGAIITAKPTSTSDGRCEVHLPRSVHAGRGRVPRADEVQHGRGDLAKLPVIIQIAEAMEECRLTRLPRSSR